MREAWKATGRPVIDKTGLDGDYQIELAYHAFDSTEGNSSDSMLDIFSAVRNQLGLKLDSERGTVDVLKVQSIAKIPTEN